MPDPGHNLFTRWIIGTRDLVSDSSNFQTIVGAGSYTAARDSIHILYAKDEPADYDSLEEQLESENADDRGTTIIHPLPRCIVNPAVAFKRYRHGIGVWRGECEIALSFEIAPSDPQDRTPDYDIEFWTFLEQVGGVFSDIEALSGQTRFADDSIDTHLNVVHYEVLDGPGDAQFANHGSRFYAVTVLLGLQG